MNLLYLSPQFPRNYINFVARLRARGGQVFGIASEPYEALPQFLRDHLTEYYRVETMHDYAQVLEAGRYFRKRYGRIDRVESHTEFWLPVEAALREDLGVWGKDRQETELIRHKSRMKDRYRAVGIPVVNGKATDNVEEAVKFGEEHGYPVILKPDSGVGAASTWKISSENELRHIFNSRQLHDYFIEQFVDGDIETFDGLTDHQGKIVYCNSLVYNRGIMETVNEDLDVAYHTVREMAPDLEAVGRRTVDAFDVREKFFHLEFFRRREDGILLGLEVNIRPPGGFTTDMWNYADDIDLYDGWAQIVMSNTFPIRWHRKFFTMYTSRKDSIPYRHSHGQLEEQLGAHLVHYERLSPLFRNALGDTGYIIRSRDLDELKSLSSLIQQRA